MSMPVIRNFVLALVVTAVVYATFLINIFNSSIYFLYAIISFFLFVLIRLTKKYYIKEDMINYMESTGNYNLATGILFILAFFLMKIEIIMLVYVVLFAASFCFSLGFLKIVLFNISVMRGLKK